MPIEEDPEIRCRFTLILGVEIDPCATVCRHLDSLGDRITKHALLASRLRRGHSPISDRRQATASGLTRRLVGQTHNLPAALIVGTVLSRGGAQAREVRQAAVTWKD